MFTTRNDELSRDVRFRVNSAISDFHAADARYHQHIKALFHPKYAELLASKASETLEVDIGLESVKKAQRENQKEMWNSIDLYDMYSEGSGFKYSRRTLIKVLVDYLGDEVVLLSSPGLASILVFKKHFALQSADDGDDKNLRIAAAAIKAEMLAADRNQHQVKFDDDTVNEGISATLMDLLGELNIGKSPSILVSMICFLIYSLIFYL